MTTPRPSASDNGFVTITTVIILVIVGFATTIGVLALLVSTTDAEIVRRDGMAAVWLADACAERTRAGLRQGASYSWDETLALGAGTCRVLSLSQTATASYEMQAVASVSGAFARVLVTFEVAADASGSVQSVTETAWERVADF